ncbi:P-loop containing nucleoside triphosphate hydrolase protein [Suillus paluster]|uniref:P-loop containing nucleoside triphosphate hydrolase protein n=1 Tax=Suillus paluster TaxID=48578 RepID=UPI001B886397|nr:P-loop containing nucleoside triphosphate hydrolase protein [Suillus paluster]KAG1750538.1 P-loop containing nucleoside triphosphate hydrolase protein [Suillus paluster]
MDCEAVSVSPMSLAALDALENLLTEFIEPLHIFQRQNIVDSFARLNFLTEGTKQPKLFQLECLMSLLTSRHVVVWAATGAGKTLAMILPLLLSPNKIAITVTPLKLLQKDHVNEFVQYGIPSIAINHDTPHDKTLWNLLAAIKNLLVALEQFFLEGGHISRLALQLKDPTFTKCIGFFFIDKAHFIITAGEAQIGEKLPFRPAYGKLAEVLIQLPVDVPVALFSATLPLQTLEKVLKSLNLPRDKMDVIKLSTNRLNIMHAVIPMLDSIKNFSNLDFLIPFPFHPPMSYPPKCLIFIDHKLRTAGVARYLNGCLPEAGINVPDIRLVVQFGVTVNLLEHEQRAGRAVQYEGVSCCDQHLDESWNINYFVPGQTLQSVIAQPINHEPGINIDSDAQVPPKKTRKKYRPTKQHSALEEVLKVWRHTVVSNDTALQGWPAKWILSDQHIESEEWSTFFGNGVHGVIDSYNKSLPRKARRVMQKPPANATATDRDLESEDDNPGQQIPHALPVDSIPLLSDFVADVYDTDAILVNPYSSASSPPSSHCSTPDLDLSLSESLTARHSCPASFAQIHASPNSRPWKRVML